MTTALEEAEELARRFEEGASEVVLPALRRLTEAAPLAALAEALPSREAVRWALALAPLSTTGGSEGAVLARLNAAAAWSRGVRDPELELRAWVSAARVRLRRGCFSELIADEPTVERLLGASGRSADQVVARIAFGHALAWDGRSEEATAYFNEARVIAEDEGYSFGRVLAVAQLAHGASHAGHRDLAQSLSEEAVALARSSGSRRAFALAHWSRGWARAAADELDQAALSLELAARTQFALQEWAPAASTWARLIEVETWRGRSAVSALRMGGLAARRATGSSAAVEVYAAAALSFRKRDSVRSEVYLQRLAAIAATEADGRAVSALEGLGQAAPEGFAKELRIVNRLPGDRIEVGRDGGWLRSPGSRREELSRRVSLQAVLRELAVALEGEPGRAVSRALLLDVGWPQGGPARNLHTAVWTLRKLGLGSALITSGDGYLLDPRACMVVA